MIQIHSELSVIDAVRKEPDKWNVISIRDKDNSKFAPIDRYTDKCIDVLPLVFDDIKEDIPGMNVKVPTKEDVQAAIDWSLNKENILVHCTAGVSRSSAIAYSILCTRMAPKEAVTHLNPHLHYPNSVVISYASEILDDEQVRNEVYWKFFAKDSGWNSF